MSKSRLGLVLCALLAAGCGGEGGPALVPVEGTVTMDGKPYANANVSFIPDASNSAVTSGSAITADDGSYKARYLSRYGLAPGKYKVTIQKLEVAGDTSTIPKEMLDDPEQLRLSGVTKEMMPPSYSDPDKTTLNIEVADGAGPYPFELDSKGR